jgi:predicted adenine nucleotide alpha hydrolase (AANH) superfamily ATPase
MMKRKNILLHVCCAPCLIYPHSVIKSEDDINMSVYYFNPNIHPSMEYARRLEALMDYCVQNNIDLRVGEYDPAFYFRAVSGNKESRCEDCYKIRLEETARYAAQEKFDVFETTLAVSPYQDHELIKDIGSDMADRYGVEFRYTDYRRGFRDGQNKSRELGMYRQAYCGCVYSESERYAKKVAQTEKKARNLNGTARST